MNGLPGSGPHHRLLTLVSGVPEMGAVSAFQVGVERDGSDGVRLC